MSENRPRLGAGDVPIVLLNEHGEEEKLVLRPSYNAARIISSQAGGLTNAMQKVGDLDLETIVSVVTLGLGYSTQTRRAPKDLAERIYRTGFSDDTGQLAERCVTYIRVLMSGGQLPVDPAPGEEGEEDPSNG